MLPGFHLMLGGMKPPWLPRKVGPVLTHAVASTCSQILRDTGVFEHTWKELELWLEHLDTTAEESKEAVIQFLERVSPAPHKEERVLEYVWLSLGTLRVCGGPAPEGSLSQLAS